MQLSYIQEKIHTLQTKLAALKKRSFTLSMIRLALTIIFLISLYIGYQEHITLLYGITFISLVVFIIMIRVHAGVQREIEDTKAYIEAYDDMIKRKNREWKQFHDQGNDFLKAEDTQAYDLDIFGRASLFQYISIAKTWEGRSYLASLLTWNKQDHTAILSRQEAVKECVQNEEFSIRVTALSKLYERHAKKKQQKKLAHIYEYMSKQEKGFPLILRLLSYILPVISFVAIFAMALWDLNYGLFLCSFMLSLVIAFLCAMKTGEILTPVDGIAEVMQDYARILEEIQKTNLHSDYLKEVQADVQDAMDGIRSLNRILDVVRMRGNFIFLTVLNGLFLADIHCVQALKAWKETYGDHVARWLKAVGRLEAIVSLTQISYAKNKVCYPAINPSEKPMIQMEAGHHPLILEGEAIANDFEAVSTSYVITGSNMSGKTTLLRTIGMNMILFQAGAAVCAKAFVANSMYLFTSMRVHDDVSEGISTFYAEILRIKEMMQFTKEKQPMIVLVDEIFKGTNSADRILCAKQAIIRLHLPWVITMVSTHDFELCDLEKDPKIKAMNYHFSEYYQDDKICFDYTLKDGRCTTTNAKQLMKIAGFWEEV